MWAGILSEISMAVYRLLSNGQDKKVHCCSCMIVMVAWLHGCVVVVVRLICYP